MKPTETLRVVGIALLIFALATGMVMAQGTDVIGVRPVSDSALFTVRVIAVLGIAFSFARMMTGHHSFHDVVPAAIGGLGVAKTQAVATFFGL